MKPKSGLLRVGLAALLLTSVAPRRAEAGLLGGLLGGIGRAAGGLFQGAARLGGGILRGAWNGLGRIAQAAPQIAQIGGQVTGLVAQGLALGGSPAAPVVGSVANLVTGIGNRSGNLGPNIANLVQTSQLSGARGGYPGAGQVAGYPGAAGGAGSYNGGGATRRVPTGSVAASGGGSRSGVTNSNLRIDPRAMNSVAGTGGAGSQGALAFPSADSPGTASVADNYRRIAQTG